jgi:hypothetical protein
MKLIKQDNNYLLIDGKTILANTDPKQVSIWPTGEFCLDLKQINTLLPIDDDDDFQIETISVKGEYHVINLKRTLRTIRNKKIEEILN